MIKQNCIVNPGVRMNTSKEKKVKLRRLIRERSLSLDPAYCRAADQAIYDHLLSLPEYQNASRIFCFVSRPEEADTHAIILHALTEGKTIAVPRCEGDGIMHAYAIQDFPGDLQPGKYGILEPAGGCMRMDPADFDLLLVPCCSCTHDGKRLGFGGGYYDRYLPQTSAVTIALCREKLILPEIPAEPFDQNMDIVLTEAGIFRRTC